MKVHHLTVEQVAAIERVSPGRVRQWITQRRIPGAEKVGAMWIVPVKYHLVRLPMGRPKKIELPEINQPQEDV